MRILLAHNFYRSTAPSGEDAVFRMELALLREAGHEVIPYTRANDDIRPGLAGSASATIELFWSRRSYREIGQLIDAQRPDVAHFHNTVPLLSASAYRACQERGVPVVQTLHNYRTICPGALLLRDGAPCEECIGRLPLPAIRHGCYRGSRTATALVAAASEWNRRSGAWTDDVDLFFCLTEFARQRLVRGGLPADKLVVKPNTLFNPPAVGAHGGNFALYVGRLTREKGIATLVDAWKDAPLPLKVVGDGALRAELEQRVARSGAAVEFLGFRDQAFVHAMMQDCRLLVIPSECYEGFPITVLEGLASGAPMLVSRIGALDELLDEPHNCRKFVPGETGNLVLKLMEMIEAPGLSGQMSALNRRRFNERYTPEAVTSRLLQHYGEIRARRVAI